MPKIICYYKWALSRVHAEKNKTGALEKRLTHMPFTHTFTGSNPVRVTTWIFASRFSGSFYFFCGLKRSKLNRKNDWYPENDWDMDEQQHDERCGSRPACERVLSAWSVTGWCASEGSPKQKLFSKATRMHRSCVMHEIKEDFIKSKSIQFWPSSRLKRIAAAGQNKKIEKTWWIYLHPKNHVLF